MIKIFRYLLLLMALLALPTRVLAHQLDEYLQATLVTIEPGEIRLQINLTPGVAVVEQVLGLIDRNRDRTISTNEAAAYAELLKRDLIVRLDERNIELKFAAMRFPEPADLRTGCAIIQVEYSVTPGVLSTGLHKFTFENQHLPAMSGYLFNALQPGSTSVRITGQKRNENQSTGEIEFDFHPPPNRSIAVAIVVSLTALFFVLLAAEWQARKRQNVDL